MRPGATAGQQFRRLVKGAPLFQSSQEIGCGLLFDLGEQIADSQWDHAETQRHGANGCGEVERRPIDRSEIAYIGSRPDDAVHHNGADDELYCRRAYREEQMPRDKIFPTAAMQRPCRVGEQKHDWPICDCITDEMTCRDERSRNSQVLKRRQK